MALFEIVMPKLGESVEEATITKWFIKENDIVKEDDILVEIATDKVDSDIPSPVAGRVTKILFPLDSKVLVGKVIAVIDLDGGLRHIKRIEFWYETKGFRKGRSRVAVWGYK